VLTLALSVGQVVLSGVYGESIVALAAIEEVKALAPVRIGDTLRTDVEVVGKRELRRPEQGLISVWYGVRNQHQEQVMTFEMRLVIRRRAPHANGAVSGTHSESQV
jgi:acyl dehydratase